MEFVEGIKISDSAALRAASLDPDAVMRTLIEAYCEQILARGFFHADPHPGNLIVQPTPTGPRLVFVDFGLAKELPGRFRRGILELAGALVEGSVDTMAQALHDLGFETRSGGIEPLTEIARAVLDIAVRLRHQAYLDPQAAREAGNELPRLIRENPIISVPSHVVLLARVIALLSGLGRTLDAHVNMLQTILPYVLKSARSGTHPRDDPAPAPPAPPA
jgi:predicted unusual protein kinase regulating ubiquinone biosynthesis (AarF/ABC1/UbiB family)